MPEAFVKPETCRDASHAFAANRETLCNLASGLQRFFAAFEEAAQATAPFIEEIGQATHRLLTAPRIEGYEKHLVRKGLAPEEAPLMAQITLRLGVKYRGEKIANRKLASAVGELARVEGAANLIVSRRAKLLAKSLEDGMALSHLRDAFLAAGIPDEECNFATLVNEAISRSSEAAARLTTICKRLGPHLDDPRGKIPTVQSATHELLLLSAGGPVSISGSADCYEDSATRGTRQAFKDFNFDPRPAQRRIRELMKGAGRGRRAANVAVEAP
jgi:hypothetical protein